MVVIPSFHGRITRELKMPIRHGKILAAKAPKVAKTWRGISSL
jgi:hypothetical protein